MTVLSEVELMRCRQNAAVAVELAAKVIYDRRTMPADKDVFWSCAEQIALTAILLHVAEITDSPTPTTITDLIAARTLAALDDEISNSPSRDARAFWLKLRTMQSRLLATVLGGVTLKWTFNPHHNEETLNDGHSQIPSTD